MRGAMSRGLFVGRFQPFHYGHYRALRWILEREDEVVLAIGSAQYSHSINNPFTLGERLEMIWLFLREEGLLDRVIMVGVPDTDGVHSMWVQQVLSLAPRFDRVYSNDPLTVRLFREAGFEVVRIPFFNRDRYRATKIREMMIRGDNWEELVPRVISEYIKKIDGVSRLRDIYHLSD